jgi:hypothetical protein
VETTTVAGDAAHATGASIRMDELNAQNRSAGSVWSVATLAIALFVILVLFAGLFGSAETATIVPPK